MQITLLQYLDDPRFSQSLCLLVTGLAGLGKTNLCKLLGWLLITMHTSLQPEKRKIIITQVIDVLKDFEMLPGQVAAFARIFCACVLLLAGFVGLACLCFFRL